MDLLRPGNAFQAGQHVLDALLVKTADGLPSCDSISHASYLIQPCVTFLRIFWHILIS
jgi:hypothetical protein